MIAENGGYNRIENLGDNVSIKGGTDDDTITNRGNTISVSGGAGNDTISNDKGGGLNSTLRGGAGDDLIINNGGDNVTILGGKGNDQISLSSDSKNNFIRYKAGDGNDTIWGITKDDTINVLAAGWTLKNSGRNDLKIVLHDAKGKLIDGEIILKDAQGKKVTVTRGESGSSGGGTGGGYGGTSSSGSSGSGGNGGGSSSGGTSSSAGSNSAASGGNSASGASGTTSNGYGGSSGNGNRNGNVSLTSNVKRNSITFSYSNNVLYPHNYLVDSNYKSGNKSATTENNTYTGGSNVITNYQQGEKIIFDEKYTGSFFNKAGDLFVGSSTGSLLVKNAVDKVVDFSDRTGKTFLKAYAPSHEGVIDGRGIAGFEVINGSTGSDEIYAGDGNSQLWGGDDSVSDTLVGGAGKDIFISGKEQGADLIIKAATKDTVHLGDATLDDIMSATESNWTISINFNTGNVVTVKGSELLSAKFELADGSAYRFNHISKKWQSA